MDQIHNQQRRQSDKEKAAVMALKKGMTLVRRDLSIVGLKPDGSETLVSKSDSIETVWTDALDQLEEKNATDSHDTLKIFTDGGSRGNPGPSASGYVIMTTEDQILEEGGEYIGVTTNNQAEYQAVKLALENARKYGQPQIDFYIDSLLVVNQMNGVFKIKNRDLWPIHQNIKELSAQFKKVTFTHVRREFNKLADAQVNQVLDSQ